MTWNARQRPRTGPVAANGADQAHGATTERAKVYKAKDGADRWEYTAHVDGFNVIGGTTSWRKAYDRTLELLRGDISGRQSSGTDPAWDGIES